MIVTRDNFLEFKTHIMEAIKSTNLVTFDLEMTGINGDETE